MYSGADSWVFGCGGGVFVGQTDLIDGFLKGSVTLMRGSGIWKGSSVTLIA